MTRSTTSAAIVAAALSLLAACSTTPRADVDGDTARADTAQGGSAAAPAPSAGQPPDSATIARLEREARALVNASGCSADSGCATAPLGSRPCGGPREYLVYCRLTTDSTALFAKLGELERAEKAYNEAHGLVSTCEMRLPPEVGSVGGSCRAR
jgi:hypothetical protein